MNKKQKICLWVGIVAFVLMGLFPPWMRPLERSAYGFLGRSCILSPPMKYDRIDLSWLCAEWAMVAVGTGGLIVTFKDKKDKRPKDNWQYANEQELLQTPDHPRGLRYRAAAGGEELKVL